jgi:peptide/nickel transport system permease protein
MKAPDDVRGGQSGAGTDTAVAGDLSQITGVAVGPAAGEARARSQWQLILRRFLRHKLAVAGTVVLAALALLAIFAPQVAPYPLNPTLDSETLAGAMSPPSAQHWFGTDELGRDQLTRVLFAGRVSLFAGVAVALSAMLIGTSLGAVAGYYRGWVDQLLMRFTDLILILPVLAVLLVASNAVGTSVTSTVVVLAALLWMPVARIVRGLFLSLREKEFVEAARASGASAARIIVRHMLPNAVGPILVNTTLNIGIAILLESTLSFLGFGVQPPTVSWGNMMAQSTQFVGTSGAYLIWFPGLAIFLTVLAVNYLGDGLRDAFDPSSRR